VRSFKDLKVWQKGHELTLWIYKATKSFPKDEMYGMTSQLRRAAASIPANIAEDCVRGSGAEFRHLLQVALGSASELEYHILLSHELGYLDKSQHESLSSKATELKRMLTSFIQKLSAANREGSQLSAARRSEVIEGSESLARGRSLKADT